MRDPKCCAPDLLFTVGKAQASKRYGHLDLVALVRNHAFGCIHDVEVHVLTTGVRDARISLDTFWICSDKIHLLSIPVRIEQHT